MPFQVNIVNLEDKISKKGNTFTLIKLLTQKGQTKEFFTSKEDLEKQGFKPSMLSDLSKGKLVPVEVEIDPFGENPKILAYKSIS